MDVVGYSDKEMHAAWWYRPSLNVDFNPKPVVQEAAPDLDSRMCTAEISLSRLQSIIRQNDQITVCLSRQRTSPFGSYCINNQHDFKGWG